MIKLSRKQRTLITRTVEQAATQQVKLPVGQHTNTPIIADFQLLLSKAI